MTTLRTSLKLVSFPEKSSRKFGSTINNESGCLRQRADQIPGKQMGRLLQFDYAFPLLSFEHERHQSSTLTFIYNSRSHTSHQVFRTKAFFIFANSVCLERLSQLFLTSTLGVKFQNGIIAFLNEQLIVGLLSAFQQ